MFNRNFLGTLAEFVFNNDCEIEKFWKHGKLLT